MRRLSNHSLIFRKYLVSYLLILLIPLITGLIAYQVSISVIRTSSIETSLMMLKQTKDILDHRLEEIEGFTRLLSMDRDLNLMLNETRRDGDASVYSLWKAWQSTSDYRFSNNFIEDYYIYEKNNNYIISPAGTFIRMGDFYKLNYYKDMNFDHWKHEILEKVHRMDILPSSPYISSQKQMNVITYVQSLPVDSFNSSKATVVLLINEGEIHKLLGRIMEQYGGWAYITDPQGRIITSLGIEEEQIIALDLPVTESDHGFDKENLLISTASDYNNWHYMVGVPKKAVFHKAYFIQKITWIITVTTLFSGIVIALLLASRNSAPINRLLGIFREQAGVQTYKVNNEYDFLHGNISRLISNKKTLEEALKRQLPLLKDAVIKRVVKGEFISIHEMKASIVQADIQLEGERGYVGIVRVNGYSGMVNEEILHELNAARLIIKTLLQEIGGCVNIADLESDKMLLLYTFAEASGTDYEKQLEEILSGIRSCIEEKYNISITVSIGTAFQSLQDAGRSFEEARETLDYAVLTKENKILWYHNIQKQTMTYYYPIDLELRLLNAAKSGEAPEVKRMLDHIFEQNFTGRKLSAEMMQQFLCELKGTLFKLLEQHKFQDARASDVMFQQLEAIRFTDSLTQVRANMMGLFEKFCGFIIQKKSDDQNKIIHQITDYLGSSYMDPDLSLYRVSEAIDLPEKYISQLFKERTGENISDYLEKIRIHKATELLFNTEQTIDEISRNVGYNSAHSFRRAFKRVSGVSPSIYRKSSS